MESIKMAGLPKKYAKLGFKNGWRAFKASKNSNSKTKTYSRGLKMAKKKNYRKGKKGFASGKVMQIIIGAGVAAVYEVFISPMIPLSRTIKNIVELAIGILLASMKKMPMAVRAGGAALATINAFELIVPLMRSSKSVVSGAVSNIEY
jgi:hypothetical protein